MLNFWKHLHSVEPDSGKVLKGGVFPARHFLVQDLKAKVKAPTRRDKATEQKDWAHVLLDFIGDSVLSTDIDAKITYMNAAAEKLIGFSRQEAIGRPVQEIFRVIDVTTREPRANLARQVMDTGFAVGLHNSALLITRDGREVAIEDAAEPLRNGIGVIVGALVKFHDSRYSAETTARMAYLAQHDALTGLLNRHSFAERFEQASALAERHQKKMVMLFVDLDNFKEVNDTLGHSSGDAILKSLGRKLVQCVRTTDLVCRYGGDEFLILLSDLTDHEQAFAVVDKVRYAAAELRDYSGHEISLELSIGVSIFPDHGTTLDKLLPHADADMYTVKACHRRSRLQPPTGNE